MPETVTITPCPMPPPADPYAPVRAEIAKLDAESWRARNASHLTRKSYQRIAALEQRAAHLKAGLPESLTAHTERQAHTEAHRAKFDRGHTLFLKRQYPALTAAKAALTNLSDPALPTSMHRQINSLTAEIDRHMNEMSGFDPGNGIPQAMLDLLPMGER